MSTPQIVDDSSRNMLLVQEGDGTMDQVPNTVKQRLKYNKTQNLYHLFSDAERSTSEQISENILLEGTAHPDIFNFYIQYPNKRSEIIQSNSITVEPLLGIVESYIENPKISLKDELIEFEKKDHIYVFSNSNDSEVEENTVRVPLLEEWVDKFKSISVTDTHIKVSRPQGSPIKVSYAGQVMYENSAVTTAFSYTVTPQPPELSYTGIRSERQLTQQEIFVLTQLTYVYDTLNFADDVDEIFNPTGSFVRFYKS